ncbi:MAG: ABC transporter permease [Bacillota bacterium]
MNETLIKNLFREIWRTKARFLSILIISMVGVAFFVGVRSSGPSMKSSADAYFDGHDMADIMIVSYGSLSENDLDAIRAVEGVDTVQPGMTGDAMMQYEQDGSKTEIAITLRSMPIRQTDPEWNGKPAVIKLPDADIDTQPDVWLNRLEVAAGRLPANDFECIIDSRITLSTDIGIGDVVAFSNNGTARDLQIVGIADSPLYISYSRGNSTLGNGKSGGFVYVSGNIIKALGPKLPVTAKLFASYSTIDVKVAGAKELDCFGKEYAALVDTVKQRIEKLDDNEKDAWKVNLREKNNESYANYKDAADSLDTIGQVFPLIFFIVAALVSLTTMTRMIEEKRVQIGTLKALGFGTGLIISEYLAYAIGASLIGGMAGVIIGYQFFPPLILSSYGVVYSITSYAPVLNTLQAVIAVLAVVGSTALATLLACKKELRAMPAALMRPRAPRKGKRIFLERIRIIWKRLSFTRKVTLRNLFRYKPRFFMSVIGIAGSCALLVTGFGLQDSVLGMYDKQFGELWHYDMTGYLAKNQTPSENKALSDSLPKRPDIDSVLFAYEQGIEITNPANGKVYSAYLNGIYDENTFSKMISLKTEDRPLKLTDEGAVITQKIANALKLKTGDTLVFTLDSKEYKAKVSGITENYIFHYVYMNDAYYRKVFDKPMPFNQFRLGVSDDEKGDAIAKELLLDERVAMVVSISKFKDTLKDMVTTINSVVWVLIVSSAVLLFVVMFNLTNINIAERERELATLKLLGFYDRETYQYIYRENRFLTVIGAAAGLFLGVWMHYLVTNSIEVGNAMFVREIEFTSYIFAAVLTMAFSEMVNVVMRRRIRRINMVESLKSVE